MATTIDELVIRLGLGIDKSTGSVLARFQGQVAVVANNVLGLAQKIWGGFERVSAAITQSGADASALVQLSQRTSLSTSAIQELGYAAEKTGGQAETLRRDLDALNMIRGSQSLEGMLTDLAGRFKGMGGQEAQQWGQMLGISNDTIRLLQQGADGMRALREEAHRAGAIISPDALKAADEYNRQLKALRTAAEAAWDSVKMKLVGALYEIIKPMAAWLQANKELIGQKLKEVFDGIAKGAQKLYDLAAPIIKRFMDWISGTGNLTDGISKLVKILGELVVAMEALKLLQFIATLGMLIAKNPELLLVAAAIAGITLAVVDLTSDDSKIKKWAASIQEEFPRLAKTIMGLGTVLSDFFSELHRELEWTTDKAYDIATLLGLTAKPNAGAAEDAAAYVNQYGGRANLAAKAAQAHANFMQSQTEIVPASGSNGQTVITDNRHITQIINGTSDPVQTANSAVTGIVNMGNPGAYAPAAQ
jgi:hypothetical protein